uniref:Perforin n=1 Tax=Neogobius melanostomus TaxID=47308 RepID=A0A8C6UNY9_9GOBI
MKKKIFLCTILLLFPHCSPQCEEGKPKECQEAEFVPGSNLAGEGFDITTMERKGAYVIDMNQWQREGNNFCTLCINPFLDNKKQKVPLVVEDWRAKQSCSTKVNSQLHKSSESLLKSVRASIKNNWKTNLNLSVADRGGSLMLAGTDSKIAKYSMDKTKSDKYSFSSQSVSCEYYRYRTSSTPKLHGDFQNAINGLPKVYDAQTKQRFYRLIDNFGTHYITKVTLGGSVQSVTSIRECESCLQGLSVQEVQMCLEMEASASIKASVSTVAKHCQRDTRQTNDTRTFSDKYSDRYEEHQRGHTEEPDLMFSSKKDPSAYKEWLKSLPQHPDIISYSLDSLHELLPPNSPPYNQLRTAISHYILERGLWKNCSAPCPAGVKTDPRDPCVCQCHNDAAVNQDCCPTQRGLARVTITVQRASGLWGDRNTLTDGYVKVFVNKKQVRRTPVIMNNNEPRWADVTDLGKVDLSTGHRVRFEVWDLDNRWNDDLLGECERDLTSGVRQDVCSLEYGRMFFKLQVECAPSLGGDLCTDYIATPMSQTLRGWFRSRYAHPVPKIPSHHNNILNLVIVHKDSPLKTVPQHTFWSQPIH